MTTAIIIGIVVCLLALGFLCYAAHVSNEEIRMFEEEYNKKMMAELEAGHLADKDNSEMLFMQ